MRSDKEFSSEALKRAGFIKARCQRWRKRLTAGALLAAFLTAAAWIALLPGMSPRADPPVMAAQAAPLMFPDAGRYMLCGVLCFVLGVALTLLCLRHGKKK